ncbi:MAG: ABC transporter permease [Synergistaceae bacterium]|jgi:cell division transport system permease protein|nr:ABC transporter permease [Synergistaceae bacterium]
MTTLKYILRDTSRLLVRHWFLGILTLITAAVMMWILGLTALFSLNVQNLLQKLESELVVQAYLRRGSEVGAVADRIRALDNVASLKAFSPEESLTKLQAGMGRSQSIDARALDLIGENPLPWNFEIHVKSAQEVPVLVRTLMAMEEIEDVIYAGMVVERVSAISRVVSKAVLVMFLLSIMVTSLVVYNTIHISLYSRREEIGIMFLVGATRSYISTPFVLEGTFLAFMGSVVAVIGITSAYLPGIRLLQQSLPFLSLLSDSRTIGQFGVLLVGFGATLGWVCSCIVVTRFMNSVTKPL